MVGLSVQIKMPNTSSWVSDIGWITSKIAQKIHCDFQYNSAKGIKLFTKNLVIPFNKCRNITSLPYVRRPNPVSQYCGHVPQVDKKPQATFHRADKQQTTQTFLFSLEALPVLDSDLWSGPCCQNNFVCYAATCW